MLNEVITLHFCGLIFVKVMHLKRLKLYLTIKYRFYAMSLPLNSDVICVWLTTTI